MNRSNFQDWVCRTNRLKSIWIWMIMMAKIRSLLWKIILLSKRVESSKSRHLLKSVKETKILTESKRDIIDDLKSDKDRDKDKNTDRDWLTVQKFPLHIRHKLRENRLLSLYRKWSDTHQRKNLRKTKNKKRKRSKRSKRNRRNKKEENTQIPTILEAAATAKSNPKNRKKTKSRRSRKNRKRTKNNNIEITLDKELVKNMELSKKVVFTVVELPESAISVALSSSKM